MIDRALEIKTVTFLLWQEWACEAIACSFSASCAVMEWYAAHLDRLTR